MPSDAMHSAEAAAKAPGAGAPTTPPATRSAERRGGVEERGVSAGSFGGVRTAAVDGAALAYREQGQGEPVVFVHGSSSICAPGSSSSRRSAPSTARSPTAAATHGPIQDIEPGADDQMLPHVDDLVVLLRVMGVAPAHLVGHSCTEQEPGRARFDGRGCYPASSGADSVSVRAVETTSATRVARCSELVSG